MIRAVFRLLVAPLVVVILAGSSVNAADVSYVISGSGATISINGEIAPGDADALRSAITRVAEAGYPISEISLNSIGGNVFEGVKIVRLVGRANLHTNVALGATCASVCFLAFAAGAKKSVDISSRVGVHVASGELGEETPASIAATGAMARIAETLLVPTDVISRMISTPATEMFWLSRSDLAKMGVTIINAGK